MLGFCVKLPWGGYEALAGEKPQALSRPPKAFGTGMIRRNIDYFGRSGHA